MKNEIPQLGEDLSNTYAGTGVSKEECKPDPFKNSVDGGTPGGRLLALKQTYDIELKWRDDLISELRKEGEKDELLVVNLESQLSRSKELLNKAKFYIPFYQFELTNEIELFLKS